MKRRSFLKKTAAAGALTLITPWGITESLAHPYAPAIADDFMTPPMSSWPQTWWHWMNGNVTKQGITLDLEAMKRVGVGGFQNFDAGTLIPKGPIVYLSPEWIELKKHTIKEAERLGLEFTMHNCPGWSSSGGPWITPELNMQQITHSELYVTGGKQISVSLPKPFSRLDFYKDAFVFAFPSLQGERSLQTLTASITSSNGAVDVRKLTGEDETGVELLGEATKPVYLQFEFKEPIEARMLTLFSAVIPVPGAPAGGGGRGAGGGGGFGGGGGAPAPAGVVLEASDDGVQFRNVTNLVAGGGGGGGGFGGGGAAASVTSEFAPTKAKFFRITSTQRRKYTQVRFSNASRIPNWMAKANFSQGANNVVPPKELAANSIINPDSVIDITKSMDQNGVLNWNAPAGEWTIVRFGHTAWGTQNRSAPDTGIGLECDKYSTAAIDFHFNKMMENLLPTLASWAGKGKVGLLIDSYEVGMQNWTPLFPDDFKKRRGYDITKYLPTLTGRIVSSVDASDRFLWDMRRTCADLMADNYYGRFAELCKKNNIISYTEPYDRGPMEEMQIGARVDVNMGEFWNGLSTQFQGNYTMRRTTKLAASIQNINGRKIVGAEAFTGEAESAKWQEYPFMMKPLGDRMFAQGLNRMIFHRYAHQPHPTALPGMTMGPWGIHFDRTNTWWEPGKAWLSYIGRCQHILQQGNFVADMLYFTGEDVALYTKVYPDELTPTPPQGYDYDLINAETILKKAKFENGRIVLGEGISYKIFVLQNYPTVTLELLRKLRDMVNQGMVMIGAKPERTPSLVGYSDNDAEYKQITTQLWGGINGTTVTENTVGSGKVYWGVGVQSVMDKINLKPDFEVSSRSGDAPITYIHRRIDGGDYYFVANQRRSVEELVLTFRVDGKQPELWDATTGKITPVKIYNVADGRVKVPVQLESCGSVFVVFRSPAANRVVSVLKESTPMITTAALTSAPAKSYKDVTNNFTITLWVKPELNTMVRAAGQGGGFGGGGGGRGAWVDWYTIYPPSAKALYGDGHETVGLVAGRNGVVIWTRADGLPIPALTAPASLSGWTHLAIVYKDAVPSVYINGKLSLEGKSSGKIMHPGVGQAHLSDGASYYNGDMTEPQVLNEVLTADRIAQLAAAEVPFTLPQGGAVETAKSGKAELLIWQDGKYTIADNARKNTVVTVTGAGKATELTGDWKVTFPEKTGAPAQVTLPKLMSLHKHSEAGVKYFSGTATYSKSFTVAAASITKGKRLFLDLGRVEIMAEVKVNGKDLGTLWTRPYKLDITDAVKAGVNTLEVKVTNQWPNRLIGDELAPEPYKFTPNAGIIELPDWYKEGKPKPEDGRVTFTTWKHYTKDSPMLEAGLIGPVVLKTAELKAI